MKNEEKFTAYFLSDLHLKDPSNEPNSLKLLGFLRSLKSKTEDKCYLFFLGDVFDIWIGGGFYFARRWQAVIDEIKRLKAAGYEVYFFEGNHDVHIHKFWERELKVPVFTKGQALQCGSTRFYLEHGDEINQQDLAYLKYRNTIRNSFFTFLADFLPGLFWQKLGERLSQISQKKSRVERAGQKEFIRALIRQYAQDIAKKVDFDFFISGHFHLDDEFEFFSPPGKKRMAINLGTWLDQKPKVLKVCQDQKPEWLKL